MADLQATIPPSNADEKSHKELYVADLQSYRPQPSIKGRLKESQIALCGRPTGHNPQSKADEKSHKELYVSDLQATTPTSNADEKELEGRILS